MMLPPHLLPKVRCKALRDACRDMPCTLRLASFLGEPCSGQDTVVGGHLDRAGGKGMGTKVSDLFIAAGCLRCHDLLDQRAGSDGFRIAHAYPAAYQLQIFRALCETQSRLVHAGLLVVPGGDIV